MILTNVRDTIHADSLALFEVNIELFLDDVTKPEKSNILTLTWPVTSLVTPRSLFCVYPRQFFRGLSNDAWIFRIGPVVSEIREGELEIAPPPSGVWYKNAPMGRRLTRAWPGGAFDAPPPEYSR